MKKCFFPFLSAIAFVFSFTGCPYWFECQNNNDPPLDKKIELLVNDFINSQNEEEGNDIEVALSCCVYSPKLLKGSDGNLVSINRGYNSMVTKEPNTASTLHCVYSISKTFTAATILNLVSQNKLSLDDAIEKFFPDICEENDISKNYLNMDATVRELLSHKSGIFDYAENPMLYSQNPFPDGVEWNPFSLMKYIEHTKQERGIFSYSSANFLILGKIAEKASGKKMNEILSESFCAPLSLGSVRLPPQDNVDFTKVSHPHVCPNTDLNLTGDGRTPIDVTTVIPNFMEALGKSSWAAGGMLATADDIARWGYELFSENGRAVSADVRKLMLDSVKDFSPEDAEAYGFGCRKIFYHSEPAGKEEHTIKKDYEFVGSYGRGLGSENLMFYNKDTDTVFVIFLSSNVSTENKPDIDKLLIYLFWNCREELLD